MIGLPVTTLDPVLDDTDDDESLVHWFCSCSPDLAYCGWDVSGHADVGEIEPTAPDMCIVCIDYPMCPRCWR